MFQWVKNLVGGRQEAPAAQLSARQQDAILARYDTSITTPENFRNWGNTDFFSARSANNFAVRRQLRIRSRYELANNPFLFGIANGNADDLIDTGPTLQLDTDEKDYDREVEEAWREWCDEVAFVEKLRTTKLARTVDGEGFLVFKTVMDLENEVKLYPVDIEADQVTTPSPENLMQYWVDGVDLHPITNRPKRYSVLKQHPGDMYYANPLAFQWVDASYVIHWFPKFRPGQVRGIPIFTSSLDLFNDMRSFRKAVMENARLVAAHTVMLETPMPPDIGVDPVFTGTEGSPIYPFFKTPINNGMETALPAGMKASTLDPKQPATTYEMWQTTCIGEACRPLAYPVNLALGTSMRFNFSSAKLDHINYRHTLNVERHDCESTVLDKAFRAWYQEAVLVGRIRAYDGLKLPKHAWHWPGYEPLDPLVDAEADTLRLSNGIMTWREFWGKRGFAWEDVAKWQQEEQKLHDEFKLRFASMNGDASMANQKHDPSGHFIEKAPSERKKQSKPEAADVA